MLNNIRAKVEAEIYRHYGQKGIAHKVARSLSKFDKRPSSSVRAHRAAQPRLSPLLGVNWRIQGSMSRMTS